MRKWTWMMGSVVAACLSAGVSAAVAQTKGTPVPDAQVESDVLKALASNPTLAAQTITSTTVYGTVTLSGSVRDETSRKLAETVVSRTPGVQKVVDELTLSTDANPVAQASSSTPSGDAGDGGTNPLLQSDGTLATAPQTATPAPSPDPQMQQQGGPAAQSDQAAAYSQQQQQPYGQAQQPYGQAQQPQQPYGRPYGSPQPNGQPEYGAPAPGQNGADQAQQAPYRRPYNQSPYGPPPGYAQPQYGAQEGGQAVTVPSGSMMRIRINQGLDSKHTQPGTVFDAVVLNDVVAGGFVAIPRGATVQGTVVEAQRGGALKGRGELALQLTQVNLAGRTFPIVSDSWSNFGPDKTLRTVNSALGLGAVGAIIGGVAGGGAGAAIGAGVGGAAGVGASAASGGGQAWIPSEAILTFHLTQPAGLTTVSQAEMDRLGYGVPVGSQMRPRYVQPRPYGYPVYYPRYPYAY